MTLTSLSRAAVVGPCFLRSSPGLGIGPRWCDGQGITELGAFSRRMWPRISSCCRAGAPLPAVVNLFRPLDRHPDLLKELTGGAIELLRFVAPKFGRQELIYLY